MKAKVFGNFEQTLTVTALLLSVLLPVAVFVFGVLRAGSVTTSGFPAPTSEQAAFTDDSGAHERW